MPLFPSIYPKINATVSLNMRNSTTHTGFLIFQNKLLIIFLKKKVGAGGKSGARADENHECNFFWPNHPLSIVDSYKYLVYIWINT